ncbi:uncharacterized protein METZ01_LOCUS121389, partial [marine metagenome]
VLDSVVKFVINSVIKFWQRRLGCPGSGGWNNPSPKRRPMPVPLNLTNPAHNFERGFRLWFLNMIAAIM